ncbi:MAG: type II secretion system F family protein [Candidatus Woesearchaeota archaeon]
MELEFKPKYLIGISISLILIIVDLYLYFLLEIKRWFFAVLVVAISIGWIQFWIDFYNESKRQKEIEVKFLEYTRNLVTNVKSGVSIPKAIVNVSNEDYGALIPYVKKLARQMEWGIPFHKAFVTFANDTKNKVIKRAIAIIIEADESGGDIEDILTSVAESMINIKKMKDERRSITFTQIVQGYIVFFVFIGVMMVLQLWLFPQISGFGFGEEEVGATTNILGFGGGLVGVGERANLDFIFFSMIMIQGFFAGIMLGKFSEGTLKQGLVHSIILITLAALIVTTAKGGI